MKRTDEHREEVDRTVTRTWDKAAGCYRYHLPDGTEVSDESGSVYWEATIEDLERTLSPPAWATFPLSSFEADDGSVDEGAARQWLRENEMAAWPESFAQAHCRVRMTAGETEPAYTRSSGRCICEACGLEYWRHPHAEEWLDWQGYPWLRRLCDGRLVKL